MALTYGEFISDPKLNPWGTANENATLAAWARYQAQQGKGGAAGAAAVAGGAGVSPTPGTLPGAAPLPGYTPAAGGIPATSDPIASTQHLIAGLLGQLGGLGPLEAGLTGISSQALRNQYPQEYFDTLGTMFGNVGRRAQGYYEDLFPLLATQSAEEGVRGGTTGSPLSSLHLKGLLGRTQYDIQEQAMRDMRLLQGLLPLVAPYPLANLIPNVNMIELAKQLANVYRSSPLPEAAYQRNLANALAGLNRGFGAGGGGGDRIVQNWQPNFWPTLPERNAPAPLNRGALGMGGGPPAAPPGEGWGMAWNPQGGFAQAGNVPQDLVGNVPPGFPQAFGQAPIDWAQGPLDWRFAPRAAPMLMPESPEWLGPLFPQQQQGGAVEPEWFMQDFGPMAPAVQETEEEWLRRLFEQEQLE